MSKTPKLRFKDENGENYPEWDNKKIGELIEYGKAGGTPLSSVSEYYNGDIKFLSISDMTEQGKYIEYTEKTITQEGLDNSSAWIVPKGHLIYSMYASVGYPAINLIDLATSQAMFSMKIRNEYSTEFIYYSLLYFKDKGLRRIIETGTQGNLNANSVKQITINIPLLPEQEKIASFLSLFDEKIELQEKKVDSLKEYKKGMMQKIFSQELRFKDENGENYPEWKSTNFSKFLSVPDKQNPEYIDKERLITVRLHQEGVQKNTNNSTLKIGSTTYYIRHAGQFIYGKQNFHNGAFGIIPTYLEGYLSSGDVPVFDIDKTVINEEYFINYIGRPQYYKNTEKLSAGTGSKRIHEDTILSLKIKLPSLPEQEKITSLLSTIDKKIELEEEKLEELKEYKKGLLQQMFV